MIFSRKRDKTKFVVGIHRERIAFSTVQQFKRQIERHSIEFKTSYCYIKPKVSGSYLVAFSEAEGFSFGDALSEHYQADNLVWCGTIDGGNNFALVIIQDGNVVSEDVFAAEQEEGLASLAALALEEVEFDVFYESEAPLPFLQYLDNATNIKNKNELSQSVIEKITPRKELRFLPDRQATAELQKGNAGFVAFICTFAAVAIVAFYLWPEEKIEYETIVLDEFKDYRTKLSSPAPVDVLRTMYNKSRGLTLSKNWVLKTCIYNAIDRAVQCTLDPSKMATVSEISSLSEKLEGDIQFKDNQAIVHFDMPLGARANIDAISPLDDVAGFVRDNIVKELMPSTLVFKERVIVDSWMTQQITFSKASIGLSALMISVLPLQGIPGAINTVRITKNYSLYQMDITLSLFGAK